MSINTDLKTAETLKNSRNKRPVLEVSYYENGQQCKKAFESLGEISLGFFNNQNITILKMYEENKALKKEIDTLKEELLNIDKQFKENMKNLAIAVSHEMTKIRDFIEQKGELM